MIVMRSGTLLRRMDIIKCKAAQGDSLANGLEVHNTGRPVLTSGTRSKGTIRIGCIPTRMTRSTIRSIIFRSRAVPINRTLRPVRKLHAGFTRATFFCPRLHAGRRKRLTFSFAVPRDLAH